MAAKAVEFYASTAGTTPVKNARGRETPATRCSGVVQYLAAWRRHFTVGRTCSQAAASAIVAACIAASE